METEQLIRTLAADNPHHARPVGYVLALALLAATPVSLVIFMMALGVRPDVMTAMRNPFFDLKFVITLALAISAIIVGLHLSRPEASIKGWGWLLLIPVGIIAAGIGGEMMMPQRLPMMTRLVGSNSRLCMSTAVVAHKLALGEDSVPVTYADLELADCFFVTGANPAWCHPILYQRMVAAKASNPACRIVVIDPRRTATW